MPRVVFGDLAELPVAEPERAGVADVSQRGAAAREQHRGQRSPVPGSVAAQAVCHGEQPTARIRRVFVVPRTAPASDEAVAASANSAVIAARRFRGLWPCRGSPGRHPPSGTQTPARPPTAGQIRKTCGNPAYLHGVIEKHRTQASRTMNAETV
jgi:hypothetical protein